MDREKRLITSIGSTRVGRAATIEPKMIPLEEKPQMQRKRIACSTLRLIKKLDSREWQIRYRAVEALGHLKDKDSVASLCERLKKDRVSDVRACAAWALGKIRDISAIGALKTALEADANARVRQTAELAVEAVYE